MNKMNIPAPFRMALPTPPLPPAVPAPPSLPPASPVPGWPLLADLSSSESDIESPEEVTSCADYLMGHISCDFALTCMICCSFSLLGF